jgi:hypothetical protein
MRFGRSWGRDVESRAERTLSHQLLVRLSLVSSLGSGANRAPGEGDPSRRHRHPFGCGFD